MQQYKVSPCIVRPCIVRKIAVRYKSPNDIDGNDYPKWNDGTSVWYEPENKGGNEPKDDGKYRIFSKRFFFLVSRNEPDQSKYDEEYDQSHANTEESGKVESEKGRG